MDIDPFKRVSKKTYENEDYKKKKTGNKLLAE